MPKFNVQVPHQLNKEEAAIRLNTFIDRVKNKFQDQVTDIQESWDGDALNFAFKAMGFAIQGKLMVEEEQLALDGKIPLAAMLFKGKIESTIHEELSSLMA